MVVLKMYTNIVTFYCDVGNVFGHSHFFMLTYMLLYTYHLLVQQKHFLLLSHMLLLYVLFCTLKCLRRRH